MPQPLIRAVREVAELIAYGDLAGVVGRCVCSRLSTQDLSRVIREYGRTPAPPPGDAYADLDAVPIRGASPPAWSVRAPLWTVEEGRSDLTLELTVSIKAGETMFDARRKV